MSQVSPPVPALPRRAARHRRASSVRQASVALGAVVAVLSASAGTAAAATPTPVPVATPIAIVAAPNIGLFGSQDPTFDGVYRQSLAVLGLVAAGQLPDANAVSWLLAQQCPDGAFTAYRAAASVVCNAANEDENSTALAIQALVALGKPTASAVAALKRFQLADGGFYDNTAFGPAASDANSTGLALSAFAAAGVDPTSVTSSAGKDGDAYLRSLQLACSATAGAGAYDFQPEATLHANDYATVQASLGELAKSLPVAAASPVATTPACPAAIVDPATSSAAALSYLAGRLLATSGAIPSAFGSGTDWTSVANAVLDLDAAAVGASAITAGLTALEGAAKAYSQTAGRSTPGPLGTLLLVAHANGVGPAAFGGVNLVSALTATERTAAAPTPGPTASPTARPTPSGTGAGSGSLPVTGVAGLLPLSALGAALLLLGLAALIAVRRPRVTMRRG